MNNPAQSKQLRALFKSYPSIKLVYLFGSQVNNKSGPLSDFDFAFYLNERNVTKRFNTKLKLINSLSSILKTDKIDVVILNDTEMPELKYNIIKDGELIYQKEPYKVIIEPAILNEYFDFHFSLKRHGLTKA